MSKLTNQQKALLKNIENDKSRETQKQQFKLQNKFDRKGVEIIFTDGQFKTDDPRVIEFLNSTPMFCKKVDEIKPQKEKSTWYSDSTKEQQVKMQKDLDRYLNFPNFPNNCESKLDTIQSGDRKENLTKEVLRDLTEPKVVESTQVKQESIAKKVIAERAELTKPIQTIMKKELEVLKKEIQSMVFGDISHLTFTFESNSGRFVFYKDKDKPFEYSGRISDMIFSDKLRIAEKIENYATELGVKLKVRSKFINKEHKPTETIESPKVNYHVVESNISKKEYNNGLDYLLLPESNHLSFIYNRLLTVHCENPNFDYMLKLRDVISKLDSK